MSAPAAVASRALMGVFEGKLNGRAIRIRESDGYVHATDICKAGGKEFSNYYKARETNEYVGDCERSLLLGRDLLVQKIMNGPNESRGTWVHPLIATHLAYWVSPKFALQVNEWALRYAKGDLSLITDIIKRHNLIHDSRTHVAAASDEKGDVVVVVQTLEIGDPKVKEYCDRLLALIERMKREHKELMDEKDGVIVQQRDEIGELKKMLQDQKRQIDEILGHTRDIKQDNKQLIVKNEVLDAKVGSMRERIGSMHDKIGGMRERIGDMHGTIGDMHSKIGRMHGTIDRLHTKVDRLAIDAVPRRDIDERLLPTVAVYFCEKKVDGKFIDLRFPYVVIRAQLRGLDAAVSRIRRERGVKLFQIARVTYYANAVTLWNQFKDVYADLNSADTHYIKFDGSSNWFRLTSRADRVGWDEREMIESFYEMARERFD